MIVFDSDLKIFYSNKINDSDYFSGFSTKELGNSLNMDNIWQFFSQNEIKYKKLVFLEQIHSANIEVFSLDGNDHLKKIDDTDGVITKEDSVILIVRTADCLPIIFVEKSKRLIGVSHQGWRGSLKKLAIKMVDKLVDKGANKKEILVAIGPGIGACCYDIDDDRYYQFLEEFDGYSDKIFHLERGKRHLNLALLNYLLLINAGVKKENIDFFPFCTSCDKKRFFSFRRDKKKDFGEMFSFVLRRS